MKTKYVNTIYDVVFDKNNNITRMGGKINRVGGDGKWVDVKYVKKNFQMEHKVDGEMMILI